MDSSTKYTHTLSHTLRIKPHSHSEQCSLQLNNFSQTGNFAIKKAHISPVNGYHTVLMKIEITFTKHASYKTEFCNTCVAFAMPNKVSLDALRLRTFQRLLRTGRSDSTCESAIVSQ